MPGDTRLVPFPNPGMLYGFNDPLLVLAASTLRCIFQLMKKFRNTSALGPPDNSNQCEVNAYGEIVPM